MRISVLCLALLGAGCASSPEYVASQSNYDVCRLTMGGPHARAAEAEARGRGLDCASMYSAIQATEAARTNAAMQFLNRPAPTLQPIQAPRQTNCRSYWMAGQMYTNCN